MYIKGWLFMKTKKILCKLIAFILILNTVLVVKENTVNAVSKKETALKAYEKL